ncbi:TetR/AcrR family transcriptional regulator [Streptomyces albus]|uniref:TetR/AcrR family transcriptional regulator n=1 Tax=Streptomyces albus TaxID=1888 RepID=UPI0005685634|nr:TetR/AcrR family transcriptional regulator [Streptomyces albus]
MGGDRLTEVLDATYDCLTRYGVRRTTVDDIAGAMGVSRSAVYQYVRGKDDAVRRLAERLHTRALERARRAASADAPPATRVRGVLEAKLGLVLELAGDSPHTAELLDEKARLFGDICHGFTAGLRTLLIGVFTGAGLVDACLGDANPAERDAAGPARPAADTRRAGAGEPDPRWPGGAGAAGSVGAVGPAEAADICIALVLGLESVPGGEQLLRPAVDALLAGLLGEARAAP